MTFLGYYFRTAICPQTGFSVSDLPVSRYLCHDKGNARVCDHITFSLLPHTLVPFRKLPLNFMIDAVWIKIARRLSFTRAMDDIETELNHLGDVADFINISSLMFWQQMILIAFELFLSSGAKIVSQSQYEQLQNTTDLKLFLVILLDHKSHTTSPPIRGPDAFAWDFYQQSGGFEQNAHFLFGRASQHRN